MKHEKQFRFIALLVLVGILFWQIIGAIMPAIGKGVRALTPFLLAFAAAYLLRHPVLWLEKLLRLPLKKHRRWPHTVATLVVLVLFLGLLSLLAAAVIPGSVNSALDIAAKIPGAARNAQTFLTEKFNTLAQSAGFEIDPTVVDNAIASFLSTAADKLQKALSDPALLSLATDTASSAVSVIVSTVMFVVGTFFLLHDYDKIKQWIKRCLRLFFKEEDKYAAACAFFGKSDRTVEKYIVVRLCTSTGLGVVTFIGFKLIGLPYAILLALIVAITNLVPYVGPVVGAIPAILIALATQGLGSAIAAFILILVCQQVEGNILTPLLVGDALNVSPLLVLLGIAVFGAMMGIPGMILGAPIAAILAGLVRSAVASAEKQAQVAEKKEIDHEIQ